MPRFVRCCVLFVSLVWISSWTTVADAWGEGVPHAVFVVGTHHYRADLTMPKLAEQVEASGFRTTVITSKEDPEHNDKGLPGIEALDDADVAIFYTRFLTLPTEQLQTVREYVESGRPVVCFRTTSHAFDYPKSDANHAWNAGFGKRVMGTQYFFHLAGETQVQMKQRHAILRGTSFRKPQTASGSLYPTSLPGDAQVLLEGTGKAKRTGEMTYPVAWTWKNEWDGRVFGTTLGHAKTFEEPEFMRLFVNGVLWAAGQDVPRPAAPAQAARKRDAKHSPIEKPAPPESPEYAKYAIFEKTAKRPSIAKPSTTQLPLSLKKGDVIAYIGNTQLDRTRHFGHLESAIHVAHPTHELVVRNLSWAGDTATLQPRPMNFADLEQHLTHVKADVVFVSFGFNESFEGEEGLPEFQQSLGSYLHGLRARAFNGKTGPQIVLVSPVANENVAGVAAADMNNGRLAMYVDVIEKVAAEHGLAFVNVFDETKKAMSDPTTDLTINGSHLNDAGYRVFAKAAFGQLFQQDYPEIPEQLRETVVDKNRQFFRRYRPANTFYYTGGRNKSYGYLDFLPAMKNFEIMVANRDQRIWDLANGNSVPEEVDDSNVPLLPESKESRGANDYLSAADELKAFKIDPRFEVNLFAGEEEFPDIGAPIQMRWDSQGRLWVACSTTYPHVYPGNEPNDKLVVLEDTDNDGRADKSTVFADDLHIPLSFEFGDGGVYLSEMPDFTFIKDTDGDGKADFRKRILTGFGTEDSHHALHDLTWTPDGDLLFREAIFHHSQVETPYGPVRQQNSGWFRFTPRTQRLTSFGTYHSTNPWGVTFDDWGQHVASHPIYAAAFHSLDPPYPLQHPKPTGLQAYSGTCGQEFVDFPNWPKEMQGGFVKVRYKPTNRVEFHKWKEGEFGYTEEYVSDIIFSSNLSFIPVDLRYGPDGAMYVCDWYNPVKGHAQYSLRDSRRDRHSGRIWRIAPKSDVSAARDRDTAMARVPKFSTASIAELLRILERPEYRHRYWAKRELRSKPHAEVKNAVDDWLGSLNKKDSRFRHHQVEALWVYRNVGEQNLELLRELLSCESHHARAAAMEQLRFWHPDVPDAIDLLRAGVNDANGIVRMQAAIAASYIGSKDALDALLDAFQHPHQGHLSYAITCALGSKNLRKHWEGNPEYQIAKLLNRAKRSNELREPTPSAGQAEFDTQKNLKTVRISCQPERMLFTVKQFEAAPGQPVKLVFSNPDATDHNLLIVKDGALEEVGMAANDMAKDPKNANGDFIPKSKADLIIQASPMIGPTRKSRVHVLRFDAPTQPGVYPYVCTFPGHWIVMRGDMVVADDQQQAAELLASRKPAMVQEWRLADFPDLQTKSDDATMMRGMTSFMKANCHQCHAVGGHGVNLGPELKDIGKRLKGRELLRHILEPSLEINKDYQAEQIIDDSGREFSGVLKTEDQQSIVLIPNLLTPNKTVTVEKSSIEVRTKSKLSSMPSGLLNVLNESEIADLISFLEKGGYKLPAHLKNKHQH